MKDMCKLCYSKAEIKERGLCNECSIFSDEQVLKNDLLENIRTSEENIQYAKEEFLQKYGWATSSEFPGGYWLWVKSVRGQTIAVSLDMAIKIEQNISHFKNKDIAEGDSIKERPRSGLTAKRG